MKKIFLIIILILAFLLMKYFNKLPFTSDSKTFTLETPGYGPETYTIPTRSVLEDSDISPDFNYPVYVEYMKSHPKIALFMSDNSQLNVKTNFFKNKQTTGKPNTISGTTVSYNQAVGIDAGTPSKTGQSNPATKLQINRTVFIINVVVELLELYCSDYTKRTSMIAPDKKYPKGSKMVPGKLIENEVMNCLNGDINFDLYYNYYTSLKLDYNTYTAIWTTLSNRLSVLNERVSRTNVDLL